MKTIWERIEQARECWNVLEHPFYQRWSRGELRPEELALYAGEYRHAVVALASALDAAAHDADSHTRPDIARHAAEEAEHVELWDRFGHAAGATRGVEPRPETTACAPVAPTSPRPSFPPESNGSADRRARWPIWRRPGRCWSISSTSRS